MRTALLALATLTAATAARAQAPPPPAPALSPVLENAQMRLELIGLRRWTVPMIQDSLRRYAPEDSLLSHACAAVLREKLHFADASVQTYSTIINGRAIDKDYVAVTVVEPQDSARVRYRATPRDSAPDVSAWAVVRQVETADHLAYQRMLQTPAYLLRDRPLAPADSGLRGALPLRAFLRAHARPADRDQALRVLATDGNARNRAAALIVLANFAGDDRAWWALADALRDSSGSVNVTAQLLLGALARGAPRRVDWAPAAPALRAVLDGTNLFAHNLLMQALAATWVDPALAPVLLRDGGDIVLAKLASRGTVERGAARALLVQLARRDLGDNPAAWRRWAATL